MKDPKLIFREYCKNNDMRYTPEREVIIEEISRNNTHFDIDSLFLNIRNSHPKIKLAKGSIYRTIPHLIKSGLLRTSLTDKGHVCYENALGQNHHDHMKCLNCGKIFEFYEGAIDRLQKELCKRRKFKMISHMHIIEGYCQRCQKK